MLRQSTSFRALRRNQKSRLQFLPGKAYATRPTPERVSVPCQSNGSIALDIYQPLNASLENAPSQTVLIYLPRGPLLRNEEDDAATVSALRSNLTWPIVQINYRFSREQPFPTPIYDVLAGYDWVVRNLLPKRSIARAGRAEHVGKVAVCGELVGGGLAAALSLTECRIGEPGIVAAAISNPLTDWVGLEPGKKKSPKKSKRTSSIGTSESGLSEEALLLLRATLFKRPRDYFDPFASPILFFRSAGKEVPSEPSISPYDDMEHLSILERGDFYRQDGTDHSSVSLSLDSDSADDIAPTSKKKTSRRFPSKALGLLLPSFRISSSLASPLNDQINEFTTLLRQSISRAIKHTATGTADFGRKALLENGEQVMSQASPQTEEDRKVSLATFEKLGLWTSSTEGTARVAELANWLKSIIP